jgi:hypothetical protein
MEVLLEAVLSMDLLRGYFNRQTEFLQNSVLRNIGNFPRCTPFRYLHTAFNHPYVYDYITKLCGRQAEVIQNHENEHVRRIGQDEATHRKYNRLKLGCGQAYNCSSD